MTAILNLCYEMDVLALKGRNIHCIKRMQLSLEKQCASVLYANEPMDTRLIKLDKKDIAYFQFILEGYEGLATATTIDKNRAVVKIFIAPRLCAGD